MMHTTSLRRYTVVLGLAILAGLLLPCGALAQADTPARVQNVVKEFVRQTGQEVVGLGSWVSGQAYKPGVSDHDLRLLVPPGTSNQAAADTWRKSRETLRTLMQKEFGSQADAMLKKTNLYPPSQLMTTVENTADAAKKYQALNSVPTLSHTGDVTAGAASKYSEGLYGEGSKAWTQHYEQTKGKLFYPANGKVYAGPADLTHMAEGQAKFTAAGMSNTTAGWAEHAAEELKGPHPDRVGKYLERMDRDLTKARELAGAAENPSLRKELQELTTELRKPGADLASLEGRVNQALKSSKLEASILSRLDDAGPAQRELLEGALKDLRAGGSLSSKLMAAAEKVPVGTILDGLMLAAVAHEAGKTAGERSIAEALAKAIPQLASLPAAVLTEITDQALEGAKEGGANLAAGSQEAWDLVAGVYSARGREQGFEQTGRKLEYTLDDLVAKIHTQERLEAFVYSRAVQAANRGGGEGLSEGDKRVGEAIYNKNLPIILKGWQQKREELRREYVRLAGRLRAAPMLMTYDPNPATLPADGKGLTVGVKAVLKEANLLTTTDRMRELVRLLAGKGVYVLVTCNFSGRPAGDNLQESYKAVKAGPLDVTATISVKCNGEAMTGENVGLRTEIVRTASVTVDVLPPPGGSGIFTGTLTSRGAAPPASIKFTIKGTKVEGQEVYKGGTVFTITGTYDPVTRTMQGRSAGTISTKIDMLAHPLKFEAMSAMTGVYDGKEFKGTWAPIGKSIGGGTWHAAGQLAADSLPPVKAAPKAGGTP